MEATLGLSLVTGPYTTRREIAAVRRVPNEVDTIRYSLMRNPFRGMKAFLC
jgi:hypothetical protein